MTKPDGDTLAGLLHRGHPRLHRPRGVRAGRVHDQLRLVEHGRHHVRDAGGIPALLFRDTTGNLQKSHELERHPRIPSRGSCHGNSQTDNHEVKSQLACSTFK